MEKEQATEEIEETETIDDGGIDEISETETETEETEETEDEPKEKESWMLTEDDEAQSMPVSAHIRVKHKLKGRISEKDDEITRLKQEIEQIKNQSMQPIKQQQPEQLTRPDPLDYTTDAEYDQAVKEYEEKALEERYNRLEAKKAYNSRIQAVNAARKKAVDDHYDRAAKLISDSAIDENVYKDSDLTVRQAIENLMPGQGDIIADQMISMLGPGSEKVMFYLGRNRNALNEFKVLLNEDSSGLKAAIYLGEQKSKLLSPAKKQSTAPKPGHKVDGDADVSTQVNANALKKKYDAAHKKGNVQEAYNVKRKAKLSGIVTANW